MDSLEQGTLVDELRTRFPGLTLRDDVPWRELTTMGAGSAAPLLAEPDDITLSGLLKFCRSEGVPVFPLGFGSDTVGSDSPVAGIFIRLKNSVFSKIKFGREHVTAGAGASLRDFARVCAENGFGGCAPLAGIPGSLGGALKMNAGRADVSIGMFVEEAFGFDSNGEPWNADKSELKFSYRSAQIPPGVVVTGAIFRLPKADPSQELDKMNGELASRRENDPKGRSAGCFFRNPSAECSAGKLLDLSGCKNMSAGDAKVSDVHANYFMNAGRAREEDIVALAIAAKKKVFENTGISLTPEVCFANGASLGKIQDSVRMARVAVLKGGTSSEREVSLESGAAVANSLRQAGYAVDEIDIRACEVTPEMKKADVVFPVLHGGFGEGGQLQELMEKAGVCFVGCGSKACADSLDKVQSKKIMLDHNISTAEYAVVKKEDRTFPSNLSLPVIVKPPCEGSTVGITIVNTMDDWNKALDECFNRDEDALVERFIEGTEGTVGIYLGKPMTMIEIHYPGKMYDYDAKYTHAKGETQYLCPPKTVSEKIQKECQRLALEFFKACGGRDVMRVDMMIDAKGGIFVLEGNSLPGFTASSLVPKAARADGMSFVELCSGFVRAALRRRAA